MASVQTVSELLDYYTNLLIIQYNNKPKARATIRLVIDKLLANGIFFDIRDAYSIETAVGVQLDVIGMYVGVDRFFNIDDPINYFSFTDYDEVSPELQEKFGLTDYANFDSFQYNGTLNYQSVLTVENRLNDEDFRVIIKLKILQNTTNHSHKEIDDGMFKFFGLSVRPDSTGDMQMYYFISQSISAIMLAALVKKILPRPMGVGLTLIKNVGAGFFGFATYSNLSPAMTIGFADYSDYDTKEGQFLTYNQMAAA